jgi:uncharacterized membrane protein HdeD (DUF308 family)
MVAAASRQWWVLVLQGVLGILFGVLALVFPGLALVTLAYVFGAWAIVSGLSHLGEGFRVAEARGRSWPFAVSGVVSIVAGLIAAFLPGITIVGLVLVLGYWLVVQGVMEIYTAWQIRREISGEWMIALGGILRIVVGLIIVAMPIVGAVLTASFLAVAAILAGLTALTFAWRLRGLRTRMTGSPGRTESAAGA